MEHGDMPASGLRALSSHVHAPEVQHQSVCQRSKAVSDILSSVPYGDNTVVPVRS